MNGTFADDAQKSLRIFTQVTAKFLKNFFDVKDVHSFEGGRVGGIKNFLDRVGIDGAIEVSGGAIGYGSRVCFRPEYSKFFTLRYSRPSGAKTEVAKISNQGKFLRPEIHIQTYWDERRRQAKIMTTHYNYLLAEIDKGNYKVKPTANGEKFYAIDSTLMPKGSFESYIVNSDGQEIK